MKTPQTFQLLTVCLLIGTISSNCFAQSDSIEKVRKSEIGLSVGPVLLVSLGAAPYPQPIGLSYKRVFGAWAFRSNFTLLPYAHNWPGFDSETLQTPDTIQVIRYTSRQSISYIGRAGCEYRYLGKRGWYIVSGADIQAQKTISERRIQEGIYRIDSIYNPGYAEPFYFVSHLSSEEQLKDNSVTTQIGLGLSIGIMIPAGKRWWIASQYRADSFFGPTKRTINDYVAGTTKKYKSNTFDFTTGPPLTEVSVFYRF